MLSWWGLTGDGGVLHNATTFCSGALAALESCVVGGIRNPDSACCRAALEVLEPFRYVIGCEDAGVDGVDEQLAREVWARCARLDAEREAVSSPPPPLPPPQQQPSEGAPVDAVLDLLGLDWRSNVTRPPPLEELLIASREEHARLEAYCGALGKKAACKGDEHCAYISATAECTVAASAVYDALGVAGWGERWESGWAAAGVGGEDGGDWQGTAEGDSVAEWDDLGDASSDEIEAGPSEAAEKEKKTKVKKDKGSKASGSKASKSKIKKVKKANKKVKKAKKDYSKKKSRKEEKNKKTKLSKGEIKRLCIGAKKKRCRELSLCSFDKKGRACLPA